MARPLTHLAPLFIGLIFLAVIGTATILVIQLRTDEISSTIDRGEVVRVALIAHEGDHPFLTTLLTYDPATQRAAVFDIPGNVGALLRGLRRVDRIDTQFDADDSTGYVAQLEDLTGVTIPHSVVFSARQLEDFVDLLGGLEVFVITDYRRLDSPDPVILPSGNVRLDGPKSVQYLRLEDELDGEAERITRRQTFVQALMREIQRNADYLVHPDVTPIRDPLVGGNLETRAETRFFEALGNIDAERIIRRRVQGTTRTVGVLDRQEALLFPHFEGQWLRQSIVQVEQTLAADADDEGGSITVTVEILNGTPTSGLARRTSELMEGYGFAVRRFGNAESNTVDRTVVIDRRGLPEFAAQVARVIDADNVVTEVLPDSLVDVTLVLGSDFDGSLVRSGNEDN